MGITDTKWVSESWRYGVKTDTNRVPELWRFWMKTYTPHVRFSSHFVCCASWALWEYTQESDGPERRYWVFVSGNQMYEVYIYL